MTVFLPPWPMRPETEFILKNKILPALQAVGSSVADVVKCQVYLRDPDDCAAFNEVWAQHFPHDPPATTPIPMPNPSLVIDYARIEVNTIALVSGACRAAAVPLRLTGDRRRRIDR